MNVTEFLRANFSSNSYDYVRVEDCVKWAHGINTEAAIFPYIILLVTYIMMFGSYYIKNEKLSVTIYYMGMYIGIFVILGVLVLIAMGLY